jgi:hypothetical protein
MIVEKEKLITNKRDKETFYFFASFMSLSLENSKETIKNYKKEVGMVAHAYIPSYLDWEDHFEANLGKKLVRSHLNQ